MRKIESHSFGARLKELRKSKNMTQEQLADELNKKYNLNESKPTISQYENNRRVPDLDRIVNIADYFHVSLDYLAYRNFENQSKEENDINREISFNTPQQALSFLLKQEMFADFGGYDLENMSDDEIMTMANDTADMMKIILRKHQK